MAQGHPGLCWQRVEPPLTFPRQGQRAWGWEGGSSAPRELPGIPRELLPHPATPGSVSGGGSLCTPTLMPQGGHRWCGAAAETGTIPNAPGFGQGKGRLCRMSQPSGSGASWGCGGIWGCFSCRERRAGTFRLHSGLGGTGKCHAAKRREGRQHREIWPGRTLPVSEIIPRRSDAAGRIRDASLSERSRPRSPPSIWQQRMRVMGESPGRKGGQHQPSLLSHRVPGSPSPLTPTTPQPKAGDKQVPGSRE